MGIANIALGTAIGVLLASFTAAVISAIGWTVVINTPYDPVDLLIIAGVVCLLGWGVLGNLARQSRRTGKQQ